MHPIVVHARRPTVDADESVAAAVGPQAPERPSKTRMKQASHELQSLGAELVELSNERLEALAMPEILLDALRQYKATRSHEGRRRQMQYIGKLTPCPP